ncbi:MAG: L-fuculokinase [Chlorobi bacterium]|nr:L-fuculokinase [Chlorobiota bacterium]
MSSAKDIIIVFDCGATNVRTVAIDTNGVILASESMTNNTKPDPEYKGGLIWDAEEIWGKLSSTCKVVLSKIDKERIAGVSITTFGVDGTFVDKSGEMLYPVISWQCNRTSDVMDNIDKYLPVKELYAEAGVYPHAFNTINKVIWLKENRPDVIDNADKFLFIPSLFVQFLTGEKVNDVTMMGTSMLTDQKNRKWSEKIFNKIDVPVSLFEPVREAGEEAGVVSAGGSEATGIPMGVPVFLAGHDTQFAIFGSGAELNQPVLSSGTWEILMVRSAGFSSTANQLNAGLTNELDAKPGIFNIGQNWLSSGVLEWFSSNFYPELKGDKLYEKMISDAMAVPPGCNGVKADVLFLKDNVHPDGGAIRGLTLNTTRGEIYRALLESLSFRLRDAMETIEDAGGFTTEKIIVVGGGSKNAFWNQLRADVCGKPVQTIEQKETTVLGAALFAMAGAGLFRSPEEARKNIDYKPNIIEPSKDVSFYR